jgi:putative ABC transport system ATP-binding protein
LFQGGVKMLRLESASKTFTRRGSEVTALQPTTLEIVAGEYVAVVGPSGSGKTTLLSVLGGMLAPTSGNVVLDGQSIYRLSVKDLTRLRGRKIGFVFQTFNLVPYLTALENVQVPLYLSGIAPKEQRRRALAVLDRVGLTDRIHHKSGELSVGQQQRVALARTLANDPALILADEPTGNLDPATREQVLEMFDKIHGEGRSILMVTHDAVAASRAGRTLRLVDGRVRDDRPGVNALQVA